MPVTVEIHDEISGNLFLNFRDMELFDPPALSKGPLLVKDFSNPVELQRINQVMMDEEVGELSNLKGLDYLVSIQKDLSYSRNPFEKLKVGFWKASPLTGVGEDKLDCSG